MTLQSKKDTTLADFSFSDEIVELYDAAAVRNVNEAIAVLFHAFLLESGLNPKDVSHAAIYKLMPQDWNANGIFKIKYSHNCCPSYTCSVTCVPLGMNVSVHGIICDTECAESVNLRINLSKYLKQKVDLLNICEVFSNMGELSRHFKDNFCLPLLNLLHERNKRAMARNTKLRKTAGVKNLFGFPGLYDDLKILILMLLPVESVVKMSSVNKNLHFLGNLPFLWKYLFKRDYAKVSARNGASSLNSYNFAGNKRAMATNAKLRKNGVPEIETSSKTDWKEMYIKEYVKKNRKPEPRHYQLPYHRLPHLYPGCHYPRFLDPDWDFDIGIDFAPPFPGSLFIPSVPPLPPFIQPRLPHFFRR